MAFDDHSGANRLARTLAERMKAESSSPLVLDFGEIAADYGLTTNTFPVKIPKGDYTVCRHISGITLGTSGGSHGGHETGNGAHSHSIPVPKLSPGDRVLVAWIQNEVTVIDIIVPASQL